MCFWWSGAVKDFRTQELLIDPWVPASSCSPWWEHFYDVELWVAPPHGLRTQWSSCCNVECVGWRTPMWRDVVDVSAAHHQVETIEVIWKSRTSPSLGWNISPVCEVIRQSRRLPSPDEKLLPIAIWRSGGQRLVAHWLLCSILCVFSTYMHVKHLEVILFLVHLV